MRRSSRTCGRLKASKGKKTAKGSWRPPAVEGATRSAALSWAGVRTIRKCANGSRPQLQFRASLASPLAAPASGNHSSIGAERKSHEKRRSPKSPAAISSSWRSSRPAKKLFQRKATRRSGDSDEMETYAVKLAPSILAADFARLGEQVAEAEKAGASRIHVDVMDGHFVPNLSMGEPIVKSLRRVTRLPLETHLMISNPDSFLEEFVAAGSDSFLIHWEGNNNLHRTVWKVKELGKRVGVVINPATPASVLEEILPDVDLVTVMTVNPGFGHQHFLHSTLPKIERVRQMIERVNASCELEVDGGVDEETASLAAEAGADVFVAGSSVFASNAGVAAAMGRLRDNIARGKG